MFNYLVLQMYGGGSIKTETKLRFAPHAMKK